MCLLRDWILVLANLLMNSIIGPTSNPHPTTTAASEIHQHTDYILDYIEPGDKKSFAKDSIQKSKLKISPTFPTESMIAFVCISSSAAAVFTDLPRY